MRVEWSNYASDDLDELVRYISRDSEFYAQLFAQRVVLATQRLKDFPESGRDCAAVLGIHFWDIQVPKRLRSAASRPVAARAVLRPSRHATSRRAMTPTMTLRRVGCLVFCLHPRSRADSDKTPGSYGYSGVVALASLHVLLQGQV